jgi:hypothetical protein
MMSPEHPKRLERMSLRPLELPLRREYHAGRQLLSVLETCGAPGVRLPSVRVVIIHGDPPPPFESEAEARAWLAAARFHEFATHEAAIKWLKSLGAT